MRIQCFEWTMEVFHVSRRSASRVPLSVDAVTALKQHIYEQIRSKDSVFVLEFKKNRFLSVDQARELRKWMEATFTVKQHSKKSVVLSNQSGIIHVLLACDKSNFDDSPPLRKKMTKKEKLEARERARKAMTNKQGTIDHKTKDFGGDESVVPTAIVEEAEGDLIDLNSQPAVDEDGNGPLTQLWYGSFNSELDLLIAALSPTK